MIGAQFDARIYRLLARRRAQAARHWPAGMQWIDTPAGRVRVYDSGGDRPPVLFVPDGPCVIEHYHELIDLLAEDARVVCLDLPGFGFSAPAADYGHRLHEGARVIAAVLDTLALERTTLALSCVNGFYALAAARLARARVHALVLCQTPGLDAMRGWTRRVVPSPIATPLLGQLLNYASRHRIATAWYRTAVADRKQQPDFTRISRNALRQGGCYCFAGVVQGMLATAEDDPLLQPLPDLPVTLIWGRRDRSHRHTDPRSLHALCPHADIVTWDDVGHFPELEAPQAYAELLRARLPS